MALLPTQNRIRYMRTEFQKLADQNMLASQEHLKKFYEAAWELAQKGTNIIGKCLNIEEIGRNTKKYLLLVMLRNCISDLCCCLDSLERGHDRTVFNNIRMIFEDFCCVVHMNYDQKIFEKFLKGNHYASKSVGPAKNLRPNDAKLSVLYGELSKISHHTCPELVARQMISRDGILSHLKPIDLKKLHVQVNPLCMIIDFLKSIAEVAEQVCL